MLKNITSIIFDLDGTLIDSAPSVLATLEATLAVHGIEPIMAFESRLIGPPLSEILMRLTGVVEPKLLNVLVETFKSLYDTSGYKASRIYPGASELLNELRQRNIPTYIATNKRRIPTELILEHLGWKPLFNAVYTLDGMETQHQNKSKMIALMLSEIDIELSHIAYVGDTFEDGLAADENNIRFYYARWGYGSVDKEGLRPAWCPMKQPLDLIGDLTEG